MHREPMLDDLLEEPIIRKMMVADGHSADDIRLLMREAGARSPAFTLMRNRALPQAGCYKSQRSTSLHPY